MLIFELIRIDEINKDIKKEEEEEEKINISRSRFIASINSSFAVEGRKKIFIEDKLQMNKR